MSLKTFSAGIGIVAASIAILANFGNATTELGRLWPLMKAALPVLGLGGMFGGLTLVGGCVWKWYVARRPEPPPSAEERFRQLAPEIKWWLETRDKKASEDRPGEKADVGTRYMTMRDGLTELGLTLPKESDDIIRLIVMANRGKLVKAHKRFPLRDKKDKSGKSD